MNSGERVLRVLSAMNQQGPCTALELHHVTGLSRQAIYRSLEVLCEQGYIERLDAGSRFRLTSRVNLLSAGFRENDWLAEIAAPAIQKVQEQLLWPTSFSAFDKGQMLKLASTQDRSPYVFSIGGVGFRLPVLGSAMGLVYLAFLSADQRRSVLELLYRSKERALELPSRQKLSETAFREMRRRGYAVRQGGFAPPTNSIAVPIIGRRSPVGAIAVTYLGSAVTTKEAVKMFFPILQKARAWIEESAALGWEGDRSTS